MCKIIIILVVIALLGSINLVGLGQPANLTDRELLVQLFSKMESIESSINRIEGGFVGIKGNTQQLDKRVTKNEADITNFFAKLEDLVLRWNTLLGLFVAFILGIFVWMWRSVYYRRHPLHNEPHKVH